MDERAESINEQYGYEIANETVSRNAINQYVRIMNWMDISVEELLRMDETPHSLMVRLLHNESGEYDYAHSVDGPYHYYDLDDEGLEWFGIAYAWDRAISEGCGAYYPQLFFNRWIPLDAEMYEISEGTPVPLPDSALQGPNRDLFVPEKYIRN